jgi:hypothetical protein
VDGNQDAIDHAKSRGTPRARFVCCDIPDIKDTELKSDGVWTSFTAAYFPRFEIFINSTGKKIGPVILFGIWIFHHLQNSRIQLLLFAFIQHKN